MNYFLMWISPKLVHNDSFDDDVDFETLFQELPSNAAVNATNNSSSPPVTTSKSGQVRSRNWGLLSDILKLPQEHLNSPVAPRTSFELGNIDAESMLLQLRDLTRRHFEPSQRGTIEPNANTSPKEGQLSDSIVPGGSSGLQLNTSQGAVKGKQVCDLQVGISAGNGGNRAAFHVEGSSEEFPMDLIVPDSPEANNKEFDKVTP
ncbi:hypothetical protein PIB30_068232, partial [Stylosanthes scabra]|nr:hypothetical protein [Stylosanthes scabra]